MAAIKRCASIDLATGVTSVTNPGYQLVTGDSGNKIYLTVTRDTVSQPALTGSTLVVIVRRPDGAVSLLTPTVESETDGTAILSVTLPIGSYAKGVNQLELRVTDANDVQISSASITLSARDPLLYSASQEIASVANSILDWLKERFLALTGGTMTGVLTLSGAPTADLQAATKGYVDAGDTASLLAAAAAQSDADAASTAADTAQTAANAAQSAADSAQTTADAALPKAGGTLTGALILAAAPTADLGAATKSYVDAAIPSAASNLVRSVNGKTGAVVLTASEVGADASGAADAVAAAADLALGRHDASYHAHSEILSGKQDNVLSTTLTIAVADWNGGTTATVCAEYVSATRIVIVDPSDPSVECTAQGDEELTFSAPATPTAAVTVKVVIFP